MSKTPETVLPLRDETTLDPSVEEKMAAHLERMVELPAGESIFPTQEPVKNFYLLRDGLVGLYRFFDTNKRILLNKILPGQTMGVTQLISNDSYPARLIPITDSRALRGNSSQLEVLKEDNPEALTKIILHENNYQANASSNLTSVLSHNVQKRIARELLELTEEIGRREESGIVLAVELSRCDMSRIVGCSQETASRILSKFEKEDILHTDNKYITIEQPEDLRAILDEN